MKRRSFLSSILAAGMAPAIVKASSIMPIWVPSKKILLPGSIQDLRVTTGVARYTLDQGYEPAGGDFTIECWAQDSQWRHIAQVQENGERYVYIDGVLQPEGALVDFQESIFDIARGRS